MSLIAVFPLVLVVALLVGGTLIAQRRGYKMGGDVIVRCRDGHLFSTIWIPGMSFKALKLGWVRLQRCPVGNHWTLVSPVNDSELTEQERETAKQYHDLPIP